jgi:HAD superfamily hydrolase (TIGR01548 family)
MPKIYSKINGLNYIEIPYEIKWQFPRENFIKNIADSDLIHITTPNSPTGELIPFEIISDIFERAQGKPILIDETYGNYSGVSNLNLVKDKENIFLVRSFSKDFALAGIRLGYVISSVSNINSLRKYLSPYNVSNLAVKAGIAALDDIEHFTNVKTKMKKSKKILSEGLLQLGAKIYPSATNFICVDFGKKADFIYKRLLDNNIKVKYYAQQEMLENCFRITIPKLENTLKVLNALEIKSTIVFDMDGVLIDASKSYRVAIKQTFNYFSGKEIFEKEISEVKKLGGLNNDWDLTEFLLIKYGYKIDKDKLIEVFQSYYTKLAEIEEPLITAEFFEKLSQKYNLAVFTGRLRKEALFTLDKNNFTKYFYPIITMDEVGINRQKPDSLGLEIIKEKIITDKIYYLGDTVDDMACAITADVNGIGVLPPQDKSEDLKKLLKSKNAMVVLKQTKDLEKFLEETEENYAKK